MNARRGDLARRLAALRGGTTSRARPTAASSRPLPREPLPGRDLQVEGCGVVRVVSEHLPVETAHGAVRLDEIELAWRRGDEAAALVRDPRLDRARLLRAAGLAMPGV